MDKTVDFSQLINDVINGDSEAFDKLYQLSYKTAYHTASLLLKNNEDIEDVLQNSYIKAYNKLPELNKPESFESWLKTIVVNECKNYIKKEKHVLAPVIFLKNKTDENSEEWKHPVPQEYMEREELRKSISDVLDKLSPEIRACIVLFHYEEKSLNEISEILDIPVGTVKSRLYNGRKQIEKEFNKLRKNDPTLLSVAAIPALLALLAYSSKNIAVPAAISEGILASTIGSASATAGTVTAATSTGAVTAASTVAVKITAVAVASSVAVGGSVAIKNHVDKLNAAETTTAYSHVFITEESGTVAEIPSEISTSELLSAEFSTQRVTTSAVNTTEIHSETSATPSTTQKQTTARQTTAKPTTSKPTTTKRTSTTAKPTTTKAPTTSKPTTKEPETDPPTTNPENNFAISGGVITDYTGGETSVSVPSRINSATVTAVGAGAFSGNTRVESVSLPSSVTQIGQEAFADCTSLKSVSLPSSLEQIGIGAFYGCSDLSSVSVPNGTKSIGDEAFAQCSSLHTVTIPSSVTSIGDDAFDGCDSLTIRCEEGSASHSYAVSNNIKFTLI